jgi:linoleoyl-CoA desaturase
MAGVANAVAGSPPNVAERGSPARAVATLGRGHFFLSAETPRHGTTEFEPGAPSARRLRFEGDNTFHLEHRRRVAEQLLAGGRSERDCPEMYRKTAIIFATFAGSYVLLVFAAAAWWQALPLAVLLALSVVAIGFNVMHDASHQA